MRAERGRSLERGRGLRKRGEGEEEGRGRGERRKEGERFEWSDVPCCGHVCVCDPLACDLCTWASPHVFGVKQGRSSESGMSIRDTEPRQIVLCVCVVLCVRVVLCVYVCMCVSEWKYVTTRVSQPWAIVRWGASNMSVRDTEPSLILWPRLNTHTHTRHTHTHTHTSHTQAHTYLTYVEPKHIHSPHILDSIHKCSNIFVQYHSLLSPPLHTCILTHGLTHRDQHTHGPTHPLAPCIAPVTIQDIRASAEERFCL